MSKYEHRHTLGAGPRVPVEALFGMWNDVVEKLDFEFYPNAKETQEGCKSAVVTTVCTRKTDEVADPNHFLCCRRAKARKSLVAGGSVGVVFQEIRIVTACDAKK